MARAIYTTVGAVVLGSCSVPPLDVTAKGCPCLDTYDCKLDAKSCSPAAQVDPKTGCVLHNDRLWCANQQADLHAEPQSASLSVAKLMSTYSYFVCWTEGDAYTKGGVTANAWYYTEGDSLGCDVGWLPGELVGTPPEFDMNPEDYGFLHAPCPDPCH